jgi:hypothetical protein
MMLVHRSLVSYWPKQNPLVLKTYTLELLLMHSLLEMCFKITLAMQAHLCRKEKFGGMRWLLNKWKIIVLPNLYNIIINYE